jgi:hypothetical protein
MGVAIGRLGGRNMALRNDCEFLWHGILGRAIERVDVVDEIPTIHIKCTCNHDHRPLHPHTS